MDLQIIGQSLALIFVIGASIYFIYRNNEIEKKIMDKSVKHK